MNSITKQLWPNVGHYTRKIIVESVEPAVKSALEGYGLSGFRDSRYSVYLFHPFQHILGGVGTREPIQQQSLLHFTRISSLFYTVHEFGFQCSAHLGGNSIGFFGRLNHGLNHRLVLRMRLGHDLGGQKTY